MTNKTTSTASTSSVISVTRRRRALSERATLGCVASASVTNPRESLLGCSPTVGGSEREKLWGPEFSVSSASSFGAWAGGASSGGGASELNEGNGSELISGAAGGGAVDAVFAGPSSGGGG